MPRYGPLMEIGLFFITETLPIAEELDYSLTKPKYLIVQRYFPFH